MSLLGTARSRIVGVYLLLAILAVAGTYEVTRLPSAIFPSVTFPLVKVVADVGNEPAARMMPTTTRPLEEAILRVPGVQTVRSTTSRGSSEISAQFAWGTDMQTALQRVEGEAQRVRPDLPPETRLDIEWMNTAFFPIEGYALVSQTKSQSELLTLAEFTLRPALVRIPGVAQVRIQGGRQREFEVHLDRQALQGRHLAVSDVVDAIRAQDQVLSAGLTERNHELYLTLVDGRVHDLEALKNLAVPVPSGGPPALLGQLGTVTVSDEISFIRTTANGQPAVLVSIVRQPSANTVAIANAVSQLLKHQPDLIPPGVRWVNFYDQARFVASSVGGTRDAILIGVALAALVLLVFLRNWRLTAIAVIVIPLTVAIVGLILGVAGQTVNLMTLAGVAAALGLIADDAIVVIEDIERHHARGDSDDPTSVSVKQLFPALLNSSLSTIVILLPFSLLTGVVGAFFKPLAFTMAVTLVVSFFIALIAVPITVQAFAAGSMGKENHGGSATRPERWIGDHGGRRVARWGASAYERVVHRFLRNGAAAAIVTVLLIGSAYLLYHRIGTNFLPAMDEGSVILDYFTPPGTSLTETDEMLNHMEEIIMANPAVESYSRRTGTRMGFGVTEPNRGDYVINLKPQKQRRGVEEVINELRDRISTVEPAVGIDFGQALEDNIGDLSGGTPQPIDVKVFGDEPSSLRQRAQQIAATLSTVPGVEDVFNGIIIAGPALEVEVDPLAAARYGLSTESIQREVEPALNGAVVDQVRVGERIYDLRVFAPAGDSLAGLKIRSRTNPADLIPLATVARVHTGAPEAEIDRENLKTYFGVTARLNGSNLGGVMSSIQQKLAAQVKLGPGESLSFGGMFQQQQESFQMLLYVLLSGLVLVAVIVLFEFGDWRAPIVVALCAMSVLAGVLALLLLTGQTLNISSYVGAIMMVGIVGENSIFVIHEAKLALEVGAGAREAWARAAHVRARPVAMTILATALALAPLALAIGEGAQLMQPLAIAVIGGFVLSGPIVLLVLPGLYRWWDPHGRLGGAGAKTKNEAPSALEPGNARG